jgi:hypothetical protein
MPKVAIRQICAIFSAKQLRTPQGSSNSQFRRVGFEALHMSVNALQNCRLPYIDAAID